MSLAVNLKKNYLFCLIQSNEDWKMNRRYNYNTVWRCGTFEDRMIRELSGVVRSKAVMLDLTVRGGVLDPSVKRMLDIIVDAPSRIHCDSIRELLHRYSGSFSEVVGRIFTDEELQAREAARRRQNIDFHLKSVGYWIERAVVEAENNHQPNEDIAVLYQECKKFHRPALKQSALEQMEEGIRTYQQKKFPNLLRPHPWFIHRLAIGRGFRRLVVRLCTLGGTCCK